MIDNRLLQPIIRMGISADVVQGAAADLDGAGLQPAQVMAVIHSIVQYNKTDIAFQDTINGMIRMIDSIGYDDALRVVRGAISDLEV